MTDLRRHKASYLTRRLAAARQVLLDPTATDDRRRGARCRMNRTLAVLRALPPIPPMTTELEVDRLARKRRESDAGSPVARSRLSRQAAEALATAALVARWVR